MSAIHQDDHEQAALWNGPAGHAWVQTQEVLDTMLQPFEDLLVRAMPPSQAWHVLDVGCGTGSTTLAAARRLGDAARCTGIDISRPMIEHARLRAWAAGLPATFVCDDAQTHPLPPHGFDRVISRFGVMFFADPKAAFGHLRRAARPGAVLHFVAWRHAHDNPFMTTAERAAAPLLPQLPARKAEGPGQFAFADDARVRRVLGASGWEDIRIQPVDLVCAFPRAELTRYALHMGPVGVALQKTDAPTRERVIDTVCRAFEPFVAGDEVRFTAACWEVTATAGGQPHHP